MQPRSIAELILTGFKKHYQLFQKITAQAPLAFAKQDWQAINDISRLRISYYDERVNETIHTLKQDHPSYELDETLWLEVKKLYQEFLCFHPQAELAETFYNSVFCRLYHRRYFHNDFIFVQATLKDAPSVPVESEYRSYFPVVDGLKPTIKRIINHFDFKAPFVDLERDIRLLVKAFYKQAPDTHHQPWKMRFDILHTAFYRNKAAYIVGRVVSESGVQPFIIAVLHHEDKGLYLDALLTKSSPYLEYLVQW